MAETLSTTVVLQDPQCFTLRFLFISPNQNRNRDEPIREITMKVYAVLAAIIAIVAATENVNAAQADGHLGAYKLINSSNVPIYYQYKWGESSEWQTGCVHPGHSMCHSFPLDEDGFASIPYVRFDCVAGDGDTTYRTYKLDSYNTCYTCGGKSYAFSFSACGHYLDLHSR